MAEEPLSLEQIKQKKLSIIKSLNDNANILSENADDHNEHLIGNVPRDMLESVYDSLDKNLQTKYFYLKYSRPWSYLLGMNNIVDVYITFPEQDDVKSQIFTKIRTEQQYQFSNFKFIKHYSDTSTLWSDYHNFRIALLSRGFIITIDTKEKILKIELSA